MSYQVLARKWRPRTFEQVVGQQPIVRALSNALSLGRLHHAYLFSGTRGVGKTTLARILAKCFSCEHGVSAKPCNQCRACQQIDDGTYVDLIEVDAASRTGVEHARELLDRVPYAPSVGAYKIYLIDEVHMLSLSSFNALLKTLEEPPEHIKFFFATTDPAKIPVTILSRCLQFNLLRLPHTVIRDYLAPMLEKEGVDFEAEALSEIAIAADGSVRDALSLLDQAIAYGNGALQNEEVKTMLGIAARSQVSALLLRVAEQDIGGVLELCNALYKTGVDFDDLLKDIIALLHQVALRQAVATAELLPRFAEAEVAALAAKIKPEDTQIYYQFALTAKRDMKVLADYKTAFEMTLLKMVCFVPLQVDRLSQSAARQAALPPAGGTPPVPSQSKAPRAAAPPPCGGVTATLPQQRSLRDCKSTSDWEQYIDALKIGGLADQLCRNSSLIVHSEKQATLVISVASKDLCTEARKAEIKDALEKLLGHAIELEFEYAQPQATPVSAADKAKQKEQRAAELSIEEDAHVQALQKKMGAKIVSGATKPRRKK